MRVALFVHCFFPDHFYGTETYTLQLAKALQALGHDVTVVSAVFQGEPRCEGVLTRYTYDSVPVIAIDKNYIAHSRISETYWQEEMRPYAQAVLSELQPQIVHVTHLLNHTAVLLEEVAAANIPIVGTLTDFFGFCYNNKLEAADSSLCGGPNRARSNCIACHLKAAGIKSRFGHRVQATGLRLAARAGWPSAGAAFVPDIVQRPAILWRAYQSYAAMIAPTAFLREAYIANGFDETRLHLSRFGVDFDRSVKPQPADGAPVTIGFIGQIAPHKGVHLLLEAVRTLPPARQVQLRIYGPEDQDAGYMARLRAMAPAGTQFLGTFPPEDMPKVLATMDVLAIPSTWYENSPLVLLNALASHTPVVISDVQGLTEFIVEGRDGWSFKRGSSADLARVLEGLSANPARVRHASGQTNYDRTTQAMGDDVARLYENVLGREG